MLLLHSNYSKTDLDNIFPAGLVGYRVDNIGRGKNILKISISVTSSLHHLIELAFNVQLWVFGLHTF